VDLAAGDDPHRVADLARRRALDLDGPDVDPCTFVVVRIMICVPRGVLAGSPAEQFDRVRNHGENGLEAFAYPLGAPRQVQDERRAAAPGDGARERGERRLFESRSPHQLGEPGRLAIDDCPCRFGRHVAGAEPSSTGRDDEGSPVSIAQFANGVLDPLALVRHDDAPDHVEAVLGEQGLRDVAGLVAARAVRYAVGHRYDGRCARRALHAPHPVRKVGPVRRRHHISAPRGLGSVRRRSKRGGTDGTVDGRARRRA
jgi:hypothetical protein